MAQEKNGCLVFLGVLVAIAAVGAGLMVVAYAGMTLIIGIDYVARAFTWLGITTPMWAWLGLGCLGGAFVGLAMGLKRAQRSPGVPVYGGAAILACLVLLGAYYGEPVQTASNDYRSSQPSQPTIQSNQFRIGNVTATVTSMQFYEEGQKSLSKGKRVYLTRFPRARTRYIGYELSLTHPDAGRQSNFTIDWTFYRPDGTVFIKNTMQSYLKNGWTNSYHQARTGWSQPGNWTAGSYRVVASANGNTVATGQFEIY